MGHGRTCFLSPAFSLHGPPTADVLIIGAGMAGLSAACELRERGLSVVVLEGRDRVGGRLLSDHSLDGRQGIDLGGAWIHGTGSAGASGEKNPVFNLAQKHGLALFPTDFADATVYGPRGTRLSPAEVEERGLLYARFEAYLLDLTAASFGPGAPPPSPHPVLDLAMRGMTRADASGLETAPSAGLNYKARGALQGQLSVQAVLDLFVAHSQLDEGQAARLAFEVHQNVEHYWAGDVADMAVNVFGEHMYEGDDVLFTQGYNQLTGAMAKGLDIRLGHVVTGIDYEPHGVRVTTSSFGVLSARFAVVTLPLGVLKSNRVCFSPPLAIGDPRKALAIQRLGTAVYNKAVLLFDAPFWDETDIILRVPVGDADRGQWSVFLNLHKVVGAPVLVGFNMGANARALEALSDDATVAAAVAALRGVYGAAAVPMPRKAIVTRWGSDPFSLMSYSYLPVGATAADFDALRAPVAGSLFFAGEACSSVHFGTVHGAHNTGVAAGREVALAAALSTVSRAAPAAEVWAERLAASARQVASLSLSSIAHAAPLISVARL